MAKKQPQNPAPPQTAPKKKTTRMRVVATKTGYYDHARRRAGDVFDIEAADFSDADRTEKNGQPAPPGWMRRVDASTELSHSTAQDEINRQHDETLAARASAAVDKDVI